MLQLPLPLFDHCVGSLRSLPPSVCVRARSSRAKQPGAECVSVRFAWRITGSSALLSSVLKKNWENMYPAPAYHHRPLPRFHTNGDKPCVPLALARRFRPYHASSSRADSTGEASMRWQGKGGNLELICCVLTLVLSLSRRPHQFIVVSVAGEIRRRPTIPIQFLPHKPSSRAAASSLLSPPSAAACHGRSRTWLDRLRPSPSKLRGARNSPSFGRPASRAMAPPPAPPGASVCTAIEGKSKGNGCACISVAGELAAGELAAGQAGAASIKAGCSVLCGAVACNSRGGRQTWGPRGGAFPDYFQKKTRDSPLVGKGCYLFVSSLVAWKHADTAARTHGVGGSAPGDVYPQKKKGGIAIIAADGSEDGDGFPRRSPTATPARAPDVPAAFSVSILLFQTGSSGQPSGIVHNKIRPSLIGAGVATSSLLLPPFLLLTGFSSTHHVTNHAPLPKPMKSVSCLVISSPRLWPPSDNGSIRRLLLLATTPTRELTHTVPAVTLITREATATCT
nr:unnamed protein product [Digitaria exilis]